MYGIHWEMIVKGYSSNLVMHLYKAGDLRETDLKNNGPNGRDILTFILS